MEKNNLLQGDFCDPTLDGNEEIEAAISDYIKTGKTEFILPILETIRERMQADGHFIFPVETCGDTPDEFRFLTLDMESGECMGVAFTGPAAADRAPRTRLLSFFIDTALESILHNPHLDGLVLNPWGEEFYLTKDMLEWLFANTIVEDAKE